MNKNEQLLNILSGRLRAMNSGEKLPPLRTMCGEYQVSLTTMNRALKELVAQHAIRMVQGSGIYATPELWQRRMPQSVDILYFGNEADLNHPGYIRDMVRHLSVTWGRDSIATTMTLLPAETSLRAAMPKLNKLQKNAVLSIFLQNQEFRYYFEEMKIPHIALSPDMIKPIPNAIYIDNEAIMEMIFTQLVSRGHRRIAYLHGACAETFSRDLYERERCFYRQCQIHGLLIDPSLVRYAGFQSDQVRAAVRELLHSRQSFTALLTSDAFAADIYEELRDCNLEPGKDIAVVGIDDTEGSQYLRPRLSSVRIPLEKIAETASGALLRMFHGGTERLPWYQIRPEWMERDSVFTIPSP